MLIKIVLFLTVLFCLPAFAARKTRCSSIIQGQLDSIGAILDEVDDSAYSRALIELRDLLFSKPNNAALVEMIARPTNDVDNPINEFDPEDRGQIVTEYLRLPENRSLLFKNFEFVLQHFITQVSIQMDDATTAQFKKPQKDLTFIDELVRENDPNFAKLLLAEIDKETESNAFMQLKGNVLEAMFINMEKWIKSPDFTLNAQLAPDEWSPQERLAWFQILMTEVDRPLPRDDVQSMISLAPKVERALQNNEIEVEGAQALRRLVFMFRLVLHWRPFLETQGTPDLLARMEPRFAAVRRLMSSNPQIAAKLAREISALDGGQLDQQAIVRKLYQDPQFKRTLFTGSTVMNELYDPQRWLTVVNPEAVLERLKQTVKVAKARNRFDKLLMSQLNTSSAKILNDPDYLKYYADDVDALLDQEPNSPKPKKMPPFRARFFSRVPGELKLGDECGDCTAVGAVNYGRSTTWFYNAGYQILTITQGHRLLLKIGLALADFDSRPVILIDSLEFNPQAHDKGLPYYEDAKEAFILALDYLKTLATAEDRELYALGQSNSSEANEILKRVALKRNIDKGSEVVNARFVYDEDHVRALLGLPEPIEISPFYQALTANPARRPISATRIVDPNSRKLETEVVNPAQMREEHLGELLSESVRAPTSDEQDRLLKSAAELILRNADDRAAIHRIYGQSTAMQLGWKFLATKLKLLYPSMALAPRRLAQGIKLNLGDRVYLLSRPSRLGTGVARWSTTRPK